MCFHISPPHLNPLGAALPPTVREIRRAFPFSPPPPVGTAFWKRSSVHFSLPSFCFTFSFSTIDLFPRFESAVPHRTFPSHDVSPTIRGSSVRICPSPSTFLVKPFPLSPECLFVFLIARPSLLRFVSFDRRTLEKPCFPSSSVASSSLRLEIHILSFF